MINLKPVAQRLGRIARHRLDTRAASHVPAADLLSIRLPTQVSEADAPRGLTFSGGRTGKRGLFRQPRNK